MKVSLRDPLPVFQLVLVNVIALALGEPVDKNGSLFSAECHERSIASAAPLPLPSDALLNQATAEIGVDKPLSCALDSLAEARVGDPFLAREAPELFRSIDPPPIPRSLMYPPQWDSSRVPKARLLRGNENATVKR